MPPSRPLAPALRHLGLVVGLLVYLLIGATGALRLAIVAGAGAWCLVTLGVVLRIRHLRRGLARALQALDAPDVHARVDALWPLFSADSVQRQQLRFARALALMVEERFAEAQAELSAIALEKLPPRGRVAVRGNAAWCRALQGDAEAAVAEAREVLREAEATCPEELSGPLTSLGACLVHAGRAQEALAPLARALAAEQENARLEGLRRFYFAEALLAVGRRDEAREAFTAALACPPPGRWEARARERLASL